MATINHVAKGQPDWQKPLNDLIDSWNALVGDNGEPLKIQTVMDAAAVTAMNGATSQGGVIYWIPVNGGKLITVNIMLTTPTTVSTETPYGQIPSNLAPNRNTTTASSYYTNTGTQIDSEGHLYSAGTTTDTATGTGKGGMTRWNATYIRKD